MKRPAQNLIVDLASFAAFVFLSATGVMLVYVLPPGSGRFTTLWGLDRHGWGDVHFWIAVLFMGLLVVHLVLHWKWIVVMVKGKGPKDPRAQLRVALGLLGLIVLLSLAAAPLLAPTDQIPRPGWRQGGSAQQVAPAPHQAVTLGEVAYVTGIPFEQLVQELGLPERTSPDERLQRLAQRHGIDIEDVRRTVRGYVAAR